MNPHTQRAGLLIQQRRYEQAERELGMALGEDPDDGPTLAVLALALANQDRHAEAAEHATQAIAAAPLDPYVCWICATVALQRNDLEECERRANLAITLAPQDARPYVTKASVFAERKKWAECLSVAEEALAIDPQNTNALNLRSLANRGLGRKESYGSDIREALHADPENPYTHTNAGWTALSQGDVATAQTHFREALRLDPTVESARVGVLETTKAGFPVYRWFLGHLMWMAKQPPRRVFLLMFGAWAIVRVLGGVADANPAWMPFVLPIALAYVGYCFATWFWRPVSNSALLLHPFARLALTAQEKTEGAICSALFLLLGSLFLYSFWDTTENSWIWFRSLIGPVLAAAFSFQHDHPKPKRILRTVAYLLTLNTAFLLTLHYGGVEIQRNLPDWVIRLAFGPLNQIRLWAGLAVIFGSQWLASRHWQAE